MRVHGCAHARRVFLHAGTVRTSIKLKLSCTVITSNKQLRIDNKHLIINISDSQMADIKKERLKR